MTRQRLNRIGGVGSMLAGVACLWLGVGDWRTGQSMWKVWLVVCFLLVWNGVAMMQYARRTERELLSRGKPSGPPAHGAAGHGAAIGGSTRV